MDSKDCLSLFVQVYLRSVSSKFWLRSIRLITWTESNVSSRMAGRHWLTSTELAITIGLCYHGVNACGFQRWLSFFFGSLTNCFTHLLTYLLTYLQWMWWCFSSRRHWQQLLQSMIRLHESSENDSEYSALLCFVLCFSVLMIIDR